MDRHQALKDIAAQAASGDLHFPLNAELGLKIKQAIDDPDCHFDQAGKLVEADPLLSAQLVAIANSVAYNPSGREITNIKTAVGRLGFATLRSIVMARIARQIAGPDGTPEIKRLSAQLWEHTTHVAALARVIAKRVTNQNPETAFFAGIVHEVGGFYLLSRAADYPGLLAPIDNRPDAEQTETSDEAQEVEHSVCLAVLKRLDVPASIIDAIEEYGRGFLALPPRTLSDTLLLADYLAPVASPLWHVASASTPRNDPAALDLSIDQDTLSHILGESAEEVASLAAALRS